MKVWTETVSESGCVALWGGGGKAKPVANNSHSELAHVQAAMSLWEMAVGVGVLKEDNMGLFKAIRIMSNKI